MKENRSPFSSRVSGFTSWLFPLFELNRPFSSLARNSCLNCSLNFDWAIWTHEHASIVGLCLTQCCYSSHMIANIQEFPNKSQSFSSRPLKCPGLVSAQEEDFLQSLWWNITLIHFHNKSWSLISECLEASNLFTAKEKHHCSMTLPPPCFTFTHQTFCSPDYQPNFNFSGFTE